MYYEIQPGSRLVGSVRVPGDKSVSHRALILAAIAEGSSEIRGLLPAHDVLATMAALRALGVRIDALNNETYLVHGVGRGGFQSPAAPLDLGNSGTAIRLLMGVLAAQPFATTLTGDSSLCGRPMDRVAHPLRRMGANVVTTSDGTPPVEINPCPSLRGIDYRLPVASAQVKSAILLAGLYASGRTCIEQPAPSRDHTERMLAAFGHPCHVVGNRVCIEGDGRLSATDIDIPSDLSSAAFFIVGATVAPGSELTLRHVGVNPTRSGLLTLLDEMGADITLNGQRDVGGEPVADITVRHARLHGVCVPESHVPLTIDELPILCIAASCASGTTRITGAQELRYKESDRIAAVAAGLRGLGIMVEELEDGMEIAGGEIAGGTVDSRGDHRIAMAFAIAALKSRDRILVSDCENVATSFPNFTTLARRLGLGIRVVDGKES